MAEKEKKMVFVVFNEYQDGSVRFGEKLRMALGLTINDDLAVNIVFSGSSVNAAKDYDVQDNDIYMRKNINGLKQMGAVFHWDSSQGVPSPVGLEAKPFDIKELDALIEPANIVIT